MRNWLAKWMRLLLALGTALPALAAGRAGEYMVLVADSRRYSGWRAWWANLYNESHLYFALATIISIPALALIMAKLTELVLSRLGINLKSRVLAEH